MLKSKKDMLMLELLENKTSLDIKKGRVNDTIYTEKDLNIPLFYIQTGSYAYNLNTKSSDKDYYLFYLPSRKDMLYKHYYPYEKPETLDKETGIPYSVKFKDITDIVDLFGNSNIQIMELVVLEKEMFEESSELEKLFNYLFENKDDLIHMNEERFISSIAGNIKQRYIKFKRDYEKDLEGYAKHYMHFYRYCKYLKLFSEGKSIFEGVKYTGEEREYLLKYRNFPLGEKEYLLEKIETEYEYYMELEKDLLKVAKPFNHDTYRKLEELVTEVTGILIKEYNVL